MVLEAPINGIIKIAGPERFRLSDVVEQYLKATNDPRTVIPDDDACYFGAHLSDNTLIPRANSRLGSINFKKWFESQSKQNAR